MKCLAPLVSVLVLVPGALPAQDVRADSLPFRRGQWAAQFGGGFGFASFGATKFRSPTSAWIMNLQVSGFHSEQLAGDAVAEIRSQASANLRLGRRRYRSVASKVMAHRSLGLLLGYSHNVGAIPGFGGTSSDGWNAGAFGDLGAAYLVSPNFSIGATAELSLTYSRSWFQTPSGKGRHWQIGGGTGIAFSATIYF